MSDPFDQFLKDLQDPAKFVRVAGVNVFDEHTEANRKGKVIRKFGKKELDWLARVNNERTRRGDLTPLTYGHTDPEEKDESRQPRHRGYALNYQVVYDRRHNKWMLRADYFFPKREYPEAVKYPFTSIELWPEDGCILPISLLRRAPQRPLGQWVYSRAGQPDTRDPLGIPTWQYARGTGKSCQWGSVLRYSMSSSWTNPGGNPMGQPNRYEMPPGADQDEVPEQFEEPIDEEMGGEMSGEMGGDAGTDAGADPGLEGAPTMEEHHAYARHCAAHPLHRRIHDHYAKHYGMAEEDPLDTPPPEHDPTDMPSADEEMPQQHSAGAFAAPGATNTHPMQNQKNKPGLGRYRTGSPEQYERRIAELERREAERAAENWLMTLDNSHCEIDEDPDEGDLANLIRAYQKGGDDACKKYVGRVMQYRKTRIDMPVGHIRTEESPRRNGAVVDLENNPEGMPYEDQLAVMAYKRKHSLWDAEWADLAAKALPQKYGKKAAGTAGRNGRKGGE